MTEALVERERLDAKIYSLLTREQRLHAEELSRIADGFFDEKNALSASGSVIVGRMKHFLCLTDAQAGNIDRSIEEALRKNPPRFDKSGNVATESNFASRQFCFHVRESRKRAYLQAEKMATILIASGNVSAKLYGSLEENQKERARNSVPLIESCIRERILEIQLSRSRQPAEPAKVEHQPIRPPLRLPVQCASTSMRH